MTYKCMIIDDEELARKLIENFVDQIEHLEVVGSYSNAIEAQIHLHESNPDILFLDIQMPRMTGLDFVKTLLVKPKIILTTAYPQYALDGYDLNVTDYLVKPFAFERFVAAVGKAVHFIELERKKEPHHEEDDNNSFMLIKANQRTYKVIYNQLQYIEGMKEYVAFHTENGRVIGLYSLKQLASELESKGFSRIHKSYIVNKRFVTSLDSQYAYLDKIKIPVGQSYRGNLEDLL